MAENKEKTLAVKSTDLPVMSKEEFQRKWIAFQEFVKESLLDGIDYGKIPGVKQKNLLKPGAEKIASRYFVYPEYQYLKEPIEDWERGLFVFEMLCLLKKMGSGEVVGTGVGSCSSYESKYRYVWVKEDELKGRRPLEEKEKESKYGKYKVYKVVRENMADVHNTILKMAKKRSFIDATLTLGNASGMFTQDLIDEDEHLESSSPTPSQKQTKPKSKKKSFSQDDYIKTLMEKLTEAVDNGDIDFAYLENMVDRIEKAKSVREKSEIISELKEKLGIGDKRRKN